MMAKCLTVNTHSSLSHTPDHIRQEFYWAINWAGVNTRFSAIGGLLEE